MGEYAEHNGERVKIGTCEDMYYLRADQAHLVRTLSGNVDPIGDAEQIRFRFPFPDEDDIEPGCFEDHYRGVRIPGYSLRDDFTGHGSVQFTSSAGYVMSIPCPEQYGERGLSVEMPDGLRVHRNGFSGQPVVRQQRYVDGALVTIISCGACEAAWRLATLDDAEPIIEAFRGEAERQEWRQDGLEFANSERQRTFLLTMAARIMAGYLAKAVA